MPRIALWQAYREFTLKTYIGLKHNSTARELAQV